MRYGTPSDSQPQESREGDPAFVGMNMTLDRSTLGEGYYALGVNKRVQTGRAERRGGTITPVYANTYSVTTLLGSGLYSNPNGQEVILEAIIHGTEHSVQMIRCGVYPQTVAVPAGSFTNVDHVEFSQDFDKVQLHRSNAAGTVFPRMAWNGVDPSGFTVVVNSTPADTARTLIPGVAWSVNMSDRDIFPVSSDSFGVSLQGDYTRYDPFFGVYRVNSGTSDPIMGIFPFVQSQLIVGKQRSLYRVLNFSGDLSNASVQVLSTDLGVWARRSFKMIGSDAIFLSRTGFFRLSQVDQTQLSVSAIPIGAYRDQSGRVVDPIKPFLDRINWPYAGNSVGTVISPYYKCAVPIDGSTVPNAVIVYNSVTDAHEGYDQWDKAAGFQIDNLLVTDYQGQPRVHCVNHNATGKGIHVLYLDTAEWDTTALGQFEIADTLETRGYASVVFLNAEGNRYGSSTRRQMDRVEIGIRSWRPNITITQLSESAFDERVLASNVTKDRTQFVTFGQPTFNANNFTDQAMKPGRQDYSCALPFYPKTGVILQKRQEDVLRFSIHGRLRWVSYRIQSTQGRCDVTGILIGSRAIQRSLRRGV